MPFAPLPPTAAWRHESSRDGFEVTFIEPTPDGVRFTGSTSAVADGVAWIVGYEIEVDAEWGTRVARVRSQGPAGVRSVTIERDRPGRWRVDGARAPGLDGLLDVDLESSALTNAFPLRRLDLAPGVAAEAPAVYLRAAELDVERLEQRYTCEAPGRFGYQAPAFGFSTTIDYDPAGLVTGYPGIAVRIA